MTKKSNFVFPDEDREIITWLAQRVQRPQVKINHAIVLGGPPGVGKDSLLAPVMMAVGRWNCAEVSPAQVMARFNGFLKFEILRVSEAHDTGETDKSKLHERMKSFIAAPPEVLRIDEKFLGEYSIPNLCGVVITTNHRTDGLYLPPNDRRHFVAWSPRKPEDFPTDYWENLWGWYETGRLRPRRRIPPGAGHFRLQPKGRAAENPGIWAIADTSSAPEDAEIADMLDDMGRPEATTLAKITSMAQGNIKFWLEDRKNRRIIPHRLKKCGYIPVRNDTAKSDGLWANRRQATNHLRKAKAGAS